MARRGDFSDFILEQLKGSEEEEEVEEEVKEAWKSLEQTYGKEELVAAKEGRRTVQRTHSIGGLSEASSVPASALRWPRLPRPS